MKDKEQYLESSEFIDFKEKNIQILANFLSRNENDHVKIAKNCFEYVRDEIKHSLDYKLNPVTCKASDVLKYKTGYCYAKSHLLTALLRANNIPSGICYQRLKIDENNSNSGYCLHGLNAVWFKDYGWYRIDARGNNTNINTDFNPPNESLAFEINNKLESNLPEIWYQPLKIITDILTSKKTYSEIYQNLPDIEIILI